MTDAGARPELPDLVAELRFARELADIADAITLPLYEKREFVVDRKPDRSEVTIADRNTDCLLYTSPSPRDS